MSVDMSDTPAGIISRLDAALARRGETVTVRRYASSGGSSRPKTDVTDRRASIRAVDAKQLAGNVKQTWSNVVLCPTGLDVLLPLREGDKIVTGGTKERNIEVVKAIVIGSTCVRIDLIVSG